MIARVARRHAWGVSGVSSTRIQRESLRRPVGCFVSSHLTKMPRSQCQCARCHEASKWRILSLTLPHVLRSRRPSDATPPTTNHATCLPCPARPFSAVSPRRPRRCVSRDARVARAHAHGSPPDRDSTRFLPLLLGSRFSARADPRLTRHPSSAFPLALQATRSVAKRTAVKVQVRPVARARLSHASACVSEARGSARKRESNNETRQLYVTTDIANRPSRSTRIIHRRPSRTTRRMSLPCP